MALQRPVLNVGSVWEVSDPDIEKIAHWIRFSTMDVVEIDIANRSVYMLANKSFGTKVRAQFVGMRHELGAA